MVGVARDVIALPDEVSDRPPAEVLTSHERQILQLFDAGNNSASIARTLRISAQTLRNHLHHINRKLGTHSRLEALTQAKQRGLIG
jgi:DNA-binding NarL/FixJ family response regulator